MKNKSLKKQTYASVPTRFFSFDAFLGEGRIDETVPGIERTNYDVKENLRDKFKSNLPRSMMPKTFGLFWDRIPIMGKRLKGSNE